MSEKNIAVSRNEGRDDAPEVRLELTREGVERVLSVYVDEPSHADDSFTLDDFTRAFRRRPRMLFAGMLIGLGLAALVVWLSPTLYSASTQVVIANQDPTAPGASAYVGSQFIATQAEVMSSPSVLADALTRVSLSMPSASGEKDLAEVLKAVSASPVSGTQVISLSYLGSSGRYGVALLNAIVKVYSEQLRASTDRRFDDNLAAKETELAELAADVSAFESRLEALRRQNGIVGSADAAAAAQSALIDSQVRTRTDVRNERLALENQLSVEGAGTVEGIPRSLQDELWQAEAELGRLKMALTPDHPSVVAAERRLDSLEAQVEQSASATPGALQQKITALRGLESELAAEEGTLRARFAMIESYREQENAILAELERLREIADARRAELLDQQMLARLAKSNGGGIVASVIAAPIEPEDAVWPRPPLVIVGGVILGLACGLLFAMMSVRRMRLNVSPARPRA